MTVFTKIITIKVKDAKRPQKEFSIYQKQLGGIDAVLLQNAAGIREATFKFICSDKHPVVPRTMEDIDRLLAQSGVKILREPKNHYNDPATNGKANHSLLIESNLDDPNLDDNLVSKAKNVHEETTTKQNIKIHNKKLEYINKHLLQVESSDKDSERLKLFDENKTKMRVGEVERA